MSSEMRRYIHIFFSYFYSRNVFCLPGKEGNCVTCGGRKKVGYWLSGGSGGGGGGGGGDGGGSGG